MTRKKGGEVDFTNMATQPKRFETSANTSQFNPKWGKFLRPVWLEFLW